MSNALAKIKYILNEMANNIATGKEYAKAELKGAPTSTFEIYMGHFSNLYFDFVREVKNLEDHPIKPSQEWIDALTTKCIAETERAIRQEKDKDPAVPQVVRPYETCFAAIIKQHLAERESL